MDDKNLRSHIEELSKRRSVRLAKLKASAGLEVPVPPGWLSARQIGKKLGIHPRQVLNYAHYWAEAGKCEVAKYRVRTLSEFKLIPHYKFAPEVAKALGL